VKQQEKLMNNDYLIEEWAFTIAVIVIAGIIYLLDKKASSFSKYSGKTRFFLSMIYSGIIGLLVFYPPAIVDDIYFVGNEYITGMALIFIPTSLFIIVFFLFMFLFRIFYLKK